ncbi:MAG: WD40 repeat domain-containing protein [Anaerolineae bacterium]|jgi:WD40 repeat protein|nr:WD40 repeat domain-containing protein [Anaerolineae bacterium]
MKWLGLVVILLGSFSTVILQTEAGIYAVVWSPDQTQIATGFTDGSIAIWDVLDGKIVDQYQAHQGEAFTIDWYDFYIASGGADGAITIWHSVERTLQKLQVNDSAHPFSAILSIAWSPNGAYLAAGDAFGTVYLWEVETQHLQELRGQDQWIFSIAWSGNSDQLAATGGEGVIIWDVQSGEIVDQLSTVNPSSLVWNPHNHNLAVGDFEGNIYLWEVMGDDILNEYPAHTDEITDLAWDPYQDRLMSVGHDGMIKIWEGSSGVLIETLVTNTLFNSIDLTRYGTQLALTGISRANGPIDLLQTEGSTSRFIGTSPIQQVILNPTETGLRKVAQSCLGDETLSDRTLENIFDRLDPLCAAELTTAFTFVR